MKSEVIFISLPLCCRIKKPEKKCSFCLLQQTCVFIKVTNFSKVKFFHLPQFVNSTKFVHCTKHARICSHLLKESYKSSKENFIFCTVVKKRLMILFMMEPDGNVLEYEGKDRNCVQVNLVKSVSIFVRLIVDFFLCYCRVIHCSQHFIYL